MLLKGIGASEGIAIYKAFVIKEDEIYYEKNAKLGSSDEIERFNKAIEIFIDKTASLVEKVRINVGKKESQILESHMIMIQDPEITGSVLSSLEAESVTAEYAITNVFDMFADMFSSMKDKLMCQRAADLKDIKNRLLEILTDAINSSIEKLDDDSIIVCHDLAPSDTGRMDKAKVKGIITETGGITSHTAIISRAMEIPTVLSVENITKRVKTDDIIAINGSTGEIIINPTMEEMDKYNALIQEREIYIKELEQYKYRETLTIDGVHVEICANIGGLDDLDAVLKNTAEGIGLFRTEFLFMDRPNLPDENDQFEVYKKVAQAMKDKPVIIRTLDIGGDKDVPYLNMDKEENPFLGFRAIRLCLGDEAMFSVQLRALLRASCYGNIKIMLPMITTLTELRISKALIEKLKSDLKNEGKPYNEKIEVGIMIETPASSLIADLLAKECDFFSIGTNDLTQYTMAVDRGNKKVQYLYSTFDPAVMRSLYNVIQAGKREGIMVGMCGKGAGDIHMIPFLLAAGLDEFSMSASAILGARKVICSLSKTELEKQLDTILNLTTEKEVYLHLKSMA